MEREQVTVRLPKELKERIEKQARMEGQSFNTEVILLLRKALGLG